MRTIGRMDFSLGHAGRLHQMLLDAVPQESAVDYLSLQKVYDGLPRSETLAVSLEQALENLVQGGHLEPKRIGGTTWYRRPRWLSTAEAAERLGVSRRTVQAWHQAGTVPGRRIGRHLRFREDDVEDLRAGYVGMTYVSGSEDPVLTELWDNDADAAYDRL